VSELIFCVVVNILRHVCIENRKRGGVEYASASAWNFAVLDSAEFVVLLPEIGLKDLGGSQEA
jgi:hypothetical protein